MSIAIQNFQTYLTTPGRSLLTLHRKPDGDSIGSNLALYQVLRLFHHSIDIVSKDPVPEKFGFLAFSNKIQILNPTYIPFKDYDYYFALDMSTPQMLGETVQSIPSKKTVVIDHHLTNNRWGNLNIIDTEAISTASLLYSLFKQLSIHISPSIANCLLTGILTDSGFLSYMNDPQPIKDVEELMKLVDYQATLFYLQRNVPFEDIPFIAKALEQMKMFKKEEVVILPISHNLWQRYGISEDKNSYLLSYLRSIQHTNFGVLLIEEKPKSIRLEFRSRFPNFDVSVIAKKLGGGGHKAAAGARIEGKRLEEAIKTILDFSE